MAGVLNGHMYNRFIRVHKLLYEALSRLQFLDFLDSCDEETKLHYRELAYTSDLATLDASNLSELYEGFNYAERKSASSQTYAFWQSYLNLLKVLLTFIRATK